MASFVKVQDYWAKCYHHYALTYNSLLNSTSVISVYCQNIFIMNIINWWDI